MVGGGTGAARHSPAGAGSPSPQGPGGTMRDQFRRTVGEKWRDRQGSRAQLDGGRLLSRYGWRGLSPAFEQACVLSLPRGRAGKCWVELLTLFDAFRSAVCGGSDVRSANLDSST